MNPTPDKDATQQPSDIARKARLAKVTAERDLFAPKDEMPDARLSPLAERLCTENDALRLERDQALAQIAELRAIFPEILKALGSGACTPDVSIEFLRHIPNEVSLVVTKLRAQIAEGAGEGA